MFSSALNGVNVSGFQNSEPIKLYVRPAACGGFENLSRTHGMCLLVPVVNWPYKKTCNILVCVCFISVRNVELNGICLTDTKYVLHILFELL